MSPDDALRLRPTCRHAAGFERLSRFTHIGAGVKSVIQARRVKLKVVNKSHIRAEGTVSSHDPWSANCFAKVTT